MRAAIYARMSTDKQAGTSPEDQVRECREYAGREGLAVVESLVMEEPAISGAFRQNRPKLMELMNRIGEWDVLLVFDFSRLSRSVEDMAWTRRQLKRHRRQAIAVSTRLGIFDVGTKYQDVANEEYRAATAAHTHRGLRGRVERGMFAGGTPYGYRTDEVHSGRTDRRGRPAPDGYRLVVEPEQADVVRRIFALYIGGEGFKAIAHRLNRERVPAPRPRRNRDKRPSWTFSSIRSLLMNPIYRGEYVWNRTEWTWEIDDVTGKKKRRKVGDRPPSEHVRRFDEAWVIVDHETWERAQQARQSKDVQRDPAGNIRKGGRTGPSHRGRHLLAGFLECAECGGSFHALKADGVCGCSWHRDRGEAVCRSELRVPMAELEARVLGAIRDQVLVPEHVAYVVEQSMAKVRAELARRDAGRLRASLAAVDDEIARLQAEASEHDLDTLLADLSRLRDERAGLRADLVTGPLPMLDKRALREEIKRRVGDVAGALAGAPDHGRAALRSLLRDGRFRVGPDPERGFHVEGLVTLALNARTARGPQASGRFTRVVAGGGFEPPTSGL